MLSDRFAFEECDAEQLLPMELDDDDIHPTEVQKPSSPEMPIILGFIESLRIHTCLSSVVKESVPAVETWCESEHLHRRVIGKCQCGRRISPVTSIQILEYRLRKLEGLLLALPPELCLPLRPSAEGSEPISHDLRRVQLESMIANIYVTNLWAQSCLWESMVALSRPSQVSSEDIPRQNVLNVWQKREEICWKLLDTLKRLSPASIEANGMILVCCQSHHRSHR